jgi:hypothetical protein
VNETYALATYGRSNIVGLVSKTNRTFRGISHDVSYGHPAETIVPTGYTPYPRTSYPLGAALLLNLKEIVSADVEDLQDGK